MRNSSPLLPRLTRIACVIAISLGSAAWAREDTVDESPSPPTLPEIVVEAEPLTPTETESTLPDDSDVPGAPSLLERSMFSSPTPEGYRAESSTTGTLIDVPDMQLPMIVDQVTPATIRDQQILNVTEALRNVPAAIAVGDDQFGDRFFLRGLEVRNRDFRRNGFLDPS